MIKIDREAIVKEIRAKRAILEIAKRKLKKDFIGLDEVIDKIFQNLEIWYTIPQAIGRPVIINLWGMTGVGKTDLVRKLVKYIGFIDRFVEMQMDCDSDYGTRSVEAKLMGSSIEEEEPGVLLLDEIQRFRTVNEQAHEIKDSKFKDMWMLLSDGRFNASGTSKTKILDKILEDLYWDDYQRADEYEDDDDEDDDDCEEEDLVSTVVKKKKKKKKKTKPYKRRYHTSVWEANSLKKSLRLKESVETIMMWSKEKKIEMITAMLSNPAAYEGSDFSKLLIFISGNIDEAYNMSNMAQDADVDANTLHEFSKKITVVDIKKALKRRFKPEQIARFGNVHIIYPAFSKKNFEALIRKKIRELISNIRKKTSIKFKIDKSVNQAIYRNGVYPAQGVRPVFSSVGAILDTNLPRFICSAIENGEDTVEVLFDNDKMKLCSIIGRKCVESDVIKLDLDSIRKKIDEDRKMSVSIHEAGHAVVYATLFNFAPPQTTSATLDHTGYVFPHSITRTKESIYDTIKVLFAGVVSERIVFGDEHATSGCHHDIASATEYACSYVRSYGFGKYRGAVDSETREESQKYLTNIADSNEAITKILEEQYQACETLIRENLPFLKEVVNALLEKGELNADQFHVIGKKYVRGLDTKKAAERIYHNYAKVGNKFLKETNEEK